MLNELKNLNLDRVNMEEAIAMLAFGRILQDEYEHAQMDTPDWLDAKLKELRREVREKNRDSAEKRLREAKLRMDSLKTPAEKKAEIKREIAELEKSLQSA